MLIRLRNIILPILLAAQTVYSWLCFYNAQFLQYDDNYRLLIHGFIISVLALIVVYLLWYYKARWIAFNRYVFVSWLLVGSPLTFIAVAIYYQSIFNTTLAT
ncbi:MAG TPA: hypothetical protein VD794_03305 [Flavisolibacter sp.]|nr:hypothetical protein [Flavisolibacter sp.]